MRESGDPTRVAGDMHQGWILRIQSKKVFSHWRGTNRVRPSSTAPSAGAASTWASQVPLVGEPGLDHHPRAIVMRHHQRVILDLFEEPGGREVRNHLFARRKTDRDRGSPPAPHR